MLLAIRTDTQKDYLASAGSRCNEENSEPLSGATVKRYATVFSSVMTEAHKMGYAEKDILHRQAIDYPRIVKPQIQAYDDDEARIFFNGLKEESPQIRALLMTSLLLGLRRGEVVGLMWSDINFKAGRFWNEQGFVFTNEFGNMITTINDLLEFEDKANVPHIRSIRGAIMELRETRPDLGIGEEHIRRCVADGRISSIKIGCRCYIAMQSFDAPYCEKIMSVQAPSFAKSDMMRRDILEQMSTAISAQVVIPKIKRARASR